MNIPLIKLNKILVRCHLFHKKLGLQSLEVIFKFNFIFTLLHCSETLPYLKKFWRGYNLAQGGKWIFGVDLIWHNRNYLNLART